MNAPARRRFSAPAARRVALLADSHGAVVAAVLDAIADSDLIVHAGDLGADVLDALRRLAPVVAVRGNNDTPARWPAEQCSSLGRLPETCVIELPGGLLGVAHGHQWPQVGRRHARLRAFFPAARAIVYGHSHRVVLDLDEEPWVVNPGACGRARAFGGAGWLGLTVGARTWRIAMNAFPDAD